MLEAADLGVALAQQQAGALGRVYGPAALVVLLLAASTWWIAPLAPTVLLFCVKPWLDRAALLVFSRTVFGQTTTPREAWQHDTLLSRSGLLSALILARLSPWRAYTQPVAQLEALRGREGRKRRSLLLHGKRGVAMLCQSLFSLAELLLTAALMSLVYWLTPFDPQGNGWPPQFMRGSDAWIYLFAGCQLVVALLLEPFFVGAGFSMYLNRRVELEAWDVEQELRRAFAT